MSSVTSRASSSRCAQSASRSAITARARRCGGTARQSGCAARAARAAASTSAAPDSGTRARTSPVAGSTSSSVSVAGGLDPPAADVVLQRLGLGRGALIAPCGGQRLGLHLRLS